MYICKNVELINLMIMTQNVLNGVYEFLSKIRINKISDRETKLGLIKIHLALHKQVEGFKADVQELQKKYFEGKEAELQTYNETVMKLQIESDESKKKELENSLDPEMKNLVNDFNSIVNSYLNKEVNVEFEKLDKDKFINALIDLDIEFTCEDLIVLEDLYK